MIDYSKLIAKIDYKFKNQSLLRLALTHSSYAKEKNLGVDCYNERLEFLGDSVLSIVISEHLYKSYAELPEGKLTKYRAIIVCEETLAELAKSLDLGEFILFSKGEEATGGRQRQSILADALEALIAAIFMDGGIAAAKTFVLKLFAEKINDAVKGRIFLDYKTALQEKVQAERQQTIEYKIIAETGPDHLKEFVAIVLIGDKQYGSGNGKSKKEAEQQAAKVAIARLFSSEE